MHFITEIFSLFLGVNLAKIHKVLNFKQLDQMKKYIDFNTEKKNNAANSLEKTFLNDDQFCLWQNNGKFTSDQ